MEKLKVCDRRCVTHQVLPKSQSVWACGPRDVLPLSCSMPIITAHSPSHTMKLNHRTLSVGLTNQAWKNNKQLCVLLSCISECGKE